MKFGSVPVAEATGVVLAHTLRQGSLVLKKGHVVAAADIAMLQAAGIVSVIGARLDSGDVPEDEAAGAIAARLSGEHVRRSAARTGRCNLEAARAGLVRVDAELIDAMNRIDESVTVATLPDLDAVKPGQVIATVKIIPFAVSAAVMARVAEFVSSPAVAVAPFAPKKVAIISTLLPGVKETVVASTEALTQDRIKAVDGTVISTTRCAHATDDCGREIARALAGGAETILIAAASATTDRHDVIPQAIVDAGGIIEHFGMPVDPGNLLVLGRIGTVPVLVLPGCARSPKLNGFDWVLRRLAAGIPVTRADIMAMGVGGLLVDTPSRPLPRDAAVRGTVAAKSPKIGAIVLAAGQSRRMGSFNKLLMPVDGVALVRRTAETVLASAARPVIVVTGHQADDLRAQLKDLDAKFVHNAAYAEGLSTSLRAGLSALPADCEGAVICLGDMPAIAPRHIDALISAFDPAAGKAIGVPVHTGKRGNPVLWARRFFDEMQAVSGDVGARHLIGANESLVYEIEFDDTAVLTDLDTPQQWADYLAGRAR
ncbi:MAG: molybdopterin-binding/glycosyltransferase family 2 protein [Rhodospirillaceae bacterium]|nr:molybdopterin-binding/glycosyltransferase family 2 protein [Rhodospirillaceae bacterium]